MVFGTVSRLWMCYCLTVSEGTHPALQVTSDPTDRIEFLAISPHSNLVAMATKHGVISCWDVGGSLCILVSCHGNDVINNDVIMMSF